MLTVCIPGIVCYIPFVQTEGYKCNMETLFTGRITLLNYFLLKSSEKP